MKKKLVLHKETLRNLSTAGLRAAVGGTTAEVSRCFSYWITCGCSQEACANTENSQCECAA
jgi:hypothetical protein